MKRLFAHSSYIIAIFALIAPLNLRAEPWTVALNKEQAQALAELAAKPGITALAISPDGPWGRAWGMKTKAASAALALASCREHVRKGKRDCVVYMVNGKRNLPNTIDIKRVQQRYKAVNGQKAASFFGLLAIDFAGNRKLSKQEYEFTKRDGQAWRSIPKSRTLERQLTGQGLVSVGKGGWAIFLTEDRAYHYTKVGRSTFEQWAISENGLLCLFFGRMENGRPRSNTCLNIDQIKRGEMRYNWAATGSKQARRGFVVAGNPGQSTVK